MVLSLNNGLALEYLMSIRESRDTIVTIGGTEKDNLETGMGQIENRSLKMCDRNFRVRIDLCFSICYVSLLK